MVNRPDALCPILVASGKNWVLAKWGCVTDDTGALGGWAMIEFILCATAALKCPFVAYVWKYG